MKRKFTKKQKNFLVQGVVPVLLVIGFVFGLTYKPPAHALSRRGKKILGIAVGAALVGATAGAAGGAKWVPLGLFGGGLTGGLIARGSNDDKNSFDELEQKKIKLEKRYNRATSASRRDRLKVKLDKVNQQLNVPPAKF